MREEQQEYTGDCQVAAAEDRHQLRKLMGFEHRLRHAVREGYPRNLTVPQPGAHEEGPEELERVDVEQHYEQQDAIEHRGDCVLEIVAAEEPVLLVPDLQQEEEGDG